MPPSRRSSPAAPGLLPRSKVGSKLDTEAALLGTIILQLLKASGIPTEIQLYYRERS